MSFRELRNFTEIMRALGYPRLISVENFRTPNFALVAHILYWLVERYDPDIRVSDVIDTENERVDFIMTITQVMMSRARIKLNAKKLYAADGYAVKELLKIASVLYSAQRSNLCSKSEEEEGEVPLSSRMQDVKAARTLASDITERGARLYDLLAQETKLQQARAKALRFLDSISGNLQSSSAENEYIERSIRELITNAQMTLENLKKQSAELEADERALESKIKKKQTDLERGEKRLKSLQTVRPAFMDEYEKLEKELQRQYEVYLARYRNIDYLEHELDLYHQSEKEKLEQSDRQLKKMQKRLREEELKLLRGEKDLKEQDGDVVPASRKEGGKAKASAAKHAHKDGAAGRAGSKASGEKGGKANGRPAAQVTGSMATRDEDESGSDDGSGDSGGGGSDSEEVSVGGASEGSGSEGSGSDLIDDDEQDGSEDLSDDDEEEGDASNDYGSADSGEDF